MCETSVFVNIYVEFGCLCFVCVICYICQIVWFPSKKKMNQIAHIANGNSTDKGRMNESQKAVLYAAYRACFQARSYGWNGRMAKYCEVSTLHFKLRHETITRWVTKWEAAGGAIQMKENSRKFNARKLSVGGYASLRRATKGSTQRAVAREKRFDDKSASNPRIMTTISPRTVARHAKMSGLVISEPKNRRIRKHFAHHLRFRVRLGAHVGRTVDVGRDMMVSDEFGVPLTLSPNKKNDTFYVEAGTQPTTNIHTHTKADDANIFSLFLIATQHGILLTHMFTQKFDVAFFHDLLRKQVRPAIVKFRRNKFSFSFFIHDHVTNSSDLFNPELMDIVFGKQKWLQHIPRICREFKGKTVQIERTDRCRAYTRKVTEPCDPCLCECKEQCYPSSSPDMNVAENIIAELRRRLWLSVKSGENVWRGRVKNKMKIVQGIVDELNKDKEYFAKLFGSVQKRYRWISEHNGDIYDA